MKFQTPAGHLLEIKISYDPAVAPIDDYGHAYHKLLKKSEPYVTLERFQKLLVEAINQAKSDESYASRMAMDAPHSSSYSKFYQSRLGGTIDPCERLLRNIYTQLLEHDKKLKKNKESKCEDQESSSLNDTSISPSVAVSDSEKEKNYMGFSSTS